MAVYGFCEKKCKWEVIPKSDIIVVKGQINIEAPRTTKLVIFSADELGVDSLKNYVVISAMQSRNTLRMDMSTNVLGTDGQCYPTVQCPNSINKLRIEVYNPGEGNGNSSYFDYCVVLMRVK